MSRTNFVNKTIYFLILILMVGIVSASDYNKLDMFAYFSEDVAVITDDIDGNDFTNNAVNLDTTNQKLGTGCGDWDLGYKTLYGTNLDHSKMATEWSIGSWIRFDGINVGASADYIWSLGTNDIRLYQYDDDLYLYNYDGSGDQASVSLTTLGIGTGEWHYFIGQHNATHIQLWIDGVLQDSATSGNTVFDSTNDHFGSNVAGGDTWVGGQMDELYFASKAFSEEEILALYNSDEGCNPVTDYCVSTFNNSSWNVTSGNLATGNNTTGWNNGEIIYITSDALSFTFNLSEAGNASCSLYDLNYSAMVAIDANYILATTDAVEQAGTLADNLEYGLNNMYCAAIKSDGTGELANSTSGPLKIYLYMPDLNVALSDGISKIQWLVSFKTGTIAYDVTPTNQTSELSLFEIYNNGTAPGNLQIKFNDTYANVITMCSNVSDYTGGIIISDDYQTIQSVEPNSVEKVDLWCIRNYTDIPAKKSLGWVFNITAE